MELRVASGSVQLDFTEAVITEPTLRIHAEVSTGTLTLITKPGIVVDTDDVSVRYGAVNVQQPEGPQAPALLTIQLSGKVGSGAISARPPRPLRARRTFWQWLRRPRPRAITRGSWS